eukprot:snap_masked-scaffold_38-processed-gene-0.15-mRNA-1 protein AED:1.00 eAED:1.00 QI:0/0/0/0/1/1/3/0/75
MLFSTISARTHGMRTSNSRNNGRDWINISKINVTILGFTLRKQLDLKLPKVYHKVKLRPKSKTWILNEIPTNAFY